MDRREIAFAAPRRGETAKAANRDRAHDETRARQRRRHQIEPGAVASDDHEVGHPHMWREQRHLGIRAGRHLIGERIDAQKAVGLRERCDRAGALARGIGDQASIAFDQRHHHEFGAAEF